MHKPFLITLGIIFVGLAGLGVFLPVLPTVPFLLLALACFARSSERLHDWLLSSKTFGPTIRHWHETRSMPLRAKYYSIISIVIAGGISVFSVNGNIMRAIVIGLLIIPVVIILKIRTTESL